MTPSHESRSEIGPFVRTQAHHCAVHPPWTRMLVPFTKHWLGPLRRSRKNAYRAPPRPSNRTRPKRVLRTVSVAGVWASPAAGRPRRAEGLVALATPRG